jgi:hypothetical protein
MRSISLRWIALIVVVVGAGVFAGALAAGQLGGLRDPSDLDAVLGEGALVRVADLERRAGHVDRGVYLSAAKGLVCLFDAPTSNPRFGGGGCNSADDPLGGRELSASLGYEGGPAAESVTDARLIGLVSSSVGSVRVEMTDGTYRSIPLRRGAAVSLPAGSLRVFGYRFKPSDLRQGIGPTAVVALDDEGAEIGRQPTGFGG